MHIRPIHNEKDYNAALTEIDRLFDAKPGTAKGDALEILVTLVEKYEAEHHPIEAPDPISAIEYFLESRGKTRKDLEPALGSRSRVYEVLQRKRPLTLAMIRKLRDILGIPAEILVQEYSLRRAA